MSQMDHPGRKSSNQKEEEEEEEEERQTGKCGSGLRASPGTAEGSSRVCQMYTVMELHLLRSRKLYRQRRRSWAAREDPSLVLPTSPTMPAPYKPR